MIDLAKEPLIHLREAAKSIPSRQTGKTAIDISTAWRWATHGVRGIKLETVHLGGGRYTSAAALQRFAERVSEAEAEARVGV